MKCPKCGTENMDNVCIRCGEILNNNQNNDKFGSVDQIFDVDTNKISQNRSDIVEEDRINDVINVNKNFNKENGYANLKQASHLEIYIGKNLNKILNRKINIIAGILGPIWLMYRKSYLMAIIYTIIYLTFGIYIILFTNSSLLIFAIITIMFNLLFLNTMYIKHCKKEIYKIKQKNSEDLKEKLKKKGGTSIIAAIIYPIIVGIIIAFIALIIYNIGIYKFNTLSVNAKGWVLTDTDNSIKLKDSNKVCNFKVEYATKEEASSLFYNYGLTTEEQFNNNELFDYTQLEQSKINNKDWYSVDFYINDVKQKLYITEDNNIIYFATFTSDTNDNYTNCEENFNKVKDSFKFD